MGTKNQKKGSNYIVQGSILAVASILVRIIGLAYRIPVTRILGPVGNSYYSAAYEVYSMVLLISSFSLPLAVSKRVSARMAKGRTKSAYKVFQCTLIFALISGGLGSLLIYFGAGFFSDVLVKTPQSRLALQVLAPTILVVALMGCMRGYFQGLGSMVPTAVSQIVEQVINAAVSISAAWGLFQYGAKLDALFSTKTAAYAWGAAGSTFGTGAGAFVGLLFLLFVIFAYSKVMKRHRRQDRGGRVESTGEIYYLLMLTILPVILSTAVYNLSGIIDQGIFKHLMAYKKYDSMKIDELWGIFSGEYKVLTNVPIAVASAMASSTIPVLTRARVNRDRREMRRKTENSIRFVMIICIRRAFRAGRTDPDPAVRGQKPSSDLGGASSDGDCFRGSVWNVHADQRHPAGNGPYAASGDPCRHFPGAACPAAGRPAYGGRSEYLCSGVGKYILCFSDVCTELPFDCKIHAVPAGGGPDIFDSSGSFRNHGSGGIRRS